MIELSSIYKTFNHGTIDEKVLFNNFNLKINDDEFVAVIGSNGSGKTTLLNIISGSTDVDGGKILLDGREINKMKDYKRAFKIGRVFQDPALGTCPSMTIWENLSIADNKGKRYDLRPGTDRRRVEAYKELLRPLGLGLENMMNSKVGSLSGGQRQALSLIMSSMTPIEFLILDEHTAALDPKTAEIIMQLTDRIVREKKLTALMVTHNLRYALEYGDRLIMMHQGGIVLDKAGEEKQAVQMDDILKIFNEISIECGN